MIKKNFQKSVINIHDCIEIKACALQEQSCALLYENNQNQVNHQREQKSVNICFIF